MTEMLDILKSLLDEVQRHQPPSTQPLLEPALSEFLQTSAQGLSVLSHTVPNHRYVDYDVALAAIAALDADSRTIGVGGGDVRHHAGLADLLQFQIFGQTITIARPDYAHKATGPDTTRSCLSFGIRLFRYEDHPVALLQREAQPRSGEDEGQLNVLCTDPEVAARLLEDVDEQSLILSVLRGQVISFSSSGYEQNIAGVTFLPRPELGAESVILPDGILGRIHRQVIGIAEQRDVLRRYGQHLKRGVLLYGPPGSGKTHTLRHLLSLTPDHTCVLLSGETLENIGLAARLARALQPAIVVLEDCDLVAEERDHMGGGKPLLFEVLDAMDGLDADADVTFLLTTNRVELMERALTQRPGRIDLAVEIPLPDEDARRQLIRLYSPAARTFSDEVMDEIAHEIEGTTASFCKELIRRAVLLAAVAGEEPADDHLVQARLALTAAQEELSRALLGGGGSDAEAEWA